MKQLMAGLSSTVAGAGGSKGAKGKGKNGKGKFSISTGINGKGKGDASIPQTRVGATPAANDGTYDFILLMMQSPSRGQSCEIANSQRALAGRINSGRRRSQAFKILAARTSGSMPPSLTPPPGCRADSGRSAAAAS